jgi:hypothetical protein
MNYTAFFALGYAMRLLASRGGLYVIDAMSQLGLAFCVRK